MNASHIQQRIPLRKRSCSVEDVNEENFHRGGPLDLDFDELTFGVQGPLDDDLGEVVVGFVYNRT